MAAWLLNAPFQRELDARAEIEPTFAEFVESTWSQERPVLPSPHQVGQELYKTVIETAPDSKRSLVYHGWVTLSSTLSASPSARCSASRSLRPLSTCRASTRA